MAELTAEARDLRHDITRIIAETVMNVTHREELYEAADKIIARLRSRTYTEEEVERAARAYYYGRPIHNPIPGKDHHQPWEEISEQWRESTRIAMRASLAALSQGGSDVR